MGSPSSEMGGVQRQTRSRSALITAAQDLLAEGQIDFRLQEAADRAEVVLQTVYNHFPTRNDLIKAAYFAALDEFESYLFERTQDVTDPLERVAMNVRIHGRLPDTHPRIAAVLFNAPIQALTGYRGYSPIAFAEMSELVEAGRLKPLNLDLALISVVASTRLLNVLRSQDPGRGIEEVDQLALQNLMLLGMTRKEAQRFVEMPLPPWPRQ